MSDLIAAFMGAHGPGMLPAARFLLNWPDFFGNAATFDLEYNASARLLVATAHYRPDDMPAGGRWRIDFWCARSGGRVMAPSMLKDPAFVADYAKCNLKLTRLTSRTIQDAIKQVAIAAACLPDGKRLPRPRLILDVNLAGGAETLIMGARGTSMFVPGAHAPNSGDEFDVRLRIPGEDPAVTDAVVTAVCRTTGPGKALGFHLSLPNVAPELSVKLKKHLADTAPPPLDPSSNRRTTTRVPAHAPVIVSPVRTATPLARAPTPAVSPPPRIMTPGGVAGFEPVPRTQTRSDTRPPEKARIAYDSSEGFMEDYVQNLSKGGAFIRTSSPAAMDAKVDLTIELPGDRTLRVLATVVHVDGSGMGVQFMLNKEIEQQLDEAIASMSASKRRALIVGEALSARLSEPLARAGFDVLTADSGTAGLSILLEETLGLDLLITVLDMPAMDGERLIDTIRGVGGDTQLAIVVVGEGIAAGRRAWLLDRQVDAIIPSSEDTEDIACEAIAALERRRGSD